MGRSHTQVIRFRVVYSVITDQFHPIVRVCNDYECNDTECKNQISWPGREFRFFQFLNPMCGESKTNQNERISADDVIGNDVF